MKPTLVRAVFDCNVYFQALILNLEKIAHVVVHVPERFVHPRDPDDAHYINLALTANAKCVVSRGRDLLDLIRSSGTTRLAVLRKQILHDYRPLSQY